MVLGRDFRGESLTAVWPSRVVSDDARGLLTWLPAGTTALQRRMPDGRRPSEATFREWDDADLVLRPTRLPHAVLSRSFLGGAYSVRWFFDPAGTFTGWYVNLEEPQVRWDDGAVAGVDTSDHELDLVVSPSRQVTWKDEAAFAERTGHARYWDAAQAAEIRALAEKLARCAAMGAPPFDGVWCDFQPDPSWSVPLLPDIGWDRRRARPTT